MQGGWCVACWMLLAVGHACALMPEISAVCCPHVTQHTRLCIVLLCLVYSQHGLVKQSVHVCVCMCGDTNTSTRECLWNVLCFAKCLARP